MLNRRIVLVVEDDLSMLEGIRDVLELDGYEVIMASSGREALECLDHVTPSLILSDVMMPEMDGYSFCERVRSNPAWATTPLIFLTAKGQKMDVRSGMHVGADDYLTKELLRSKRERQVSTSCVSSTFQPVAIASMRREILGLTSATIARKTSSYPLTS